MKNAGKLMMVVLLLALSAMLHAQAVDIDSIDPSELDMSKADVSDVQLYFNGPLELYITGIGYAGESYAAVLEYDGVSTISVGVPEVAATEGKPRAVDLSEISIRPTSSGLRVSDLIIDDRYVAGTLRLLSNNDLAIDSFETGAQAGRRVSELLRQIRSLEQSIEQKDQRIARLNQQIEELPEPEQVRELRTQTRELEDQLQTSRESVSTLEARLEDRADELERLNQQVDSLQITVTNRDQRIERLNRQLDEAPDEGRLIELRTQMSEVESTLEDAQAKIALLEGELAAASRENRALLTRVSQLRDPWNIADELLPSVVEAVFGAGRSRLGSWDVSGGTLIQSDPDQRFAKYVIPARQPTGGDLMYSITGRAYASGWSGFGLHFLASGHETARGYGFGVSYLVWVSVDPEVNRNERVYAELYRSYTDVRMEKLASVAIQESISESTTIEVYVDRDGGRVTVIVEGEELFSFSNESLIRSGDVVAVRALGEVEVTDLRIIAEQ